MSRTPEGDYFVRCAVSLRYTAPRSLAHALSTCPPGWHRYVREIFRLVVDTAGGRVWDCEPRFAELDLGIELPDDVPAEIVQAINACVAGTAATCEACGGHGTLRDTRNWLRVLCDLCDCEVDAQGWSDLYQRFRAEEPRSGLT